MTLESGLSIVKTESRCWTERVYQHHDGKLRTTHEVCRLLPSFLGDVPRACNKPVACQPSRLVLPSPPDGGCTGYDGVLGAVSRLGDENWAHNKECQQDELANGAKVGQQPSHVQRIGQSQRLEDWIGYWREILGEMHDGAPGQ